MGALLFTVLWVAMVPLGVFVLVNTVASVSTSNRDDETKNKETNPTTIERTALCSAYCPP